MMIFRHVPNPEQVPTPSDIQASIQRWQNWIGEVAGQGKFVSTNQLGYEGKTIQQDGLITDGPYTEVKEIVGGYLVLKADSLEDAMKIAHACPILVEGGNVEVRNIMSLDVSLTDD
ncbi:MAG: YciI family protein [Bacteroidota bacterium]